MVSVFRNMLFSKYLINQSTASIYGSITIVCCIDFGSVNVIFRILHTSAGTSIIIQCMAEMQIRYISPAMAMLSKAWRLLQSQIYFICLCRFQYKFEFVPRLKDSPPI